MWKEEKKEWDSRLLACLCILFPFSNCHSQSRLHSVFAAAAAEEVYYEGARLEIDIVVVDIKLFFSASEDFILLVTKDSVAVAAAMERCSNSEQQQQQWAAAEINTAAALSSTELK